MEKSLVKSFLACSNRKTILKVRTTKCKIGFPARRDWGSCSTTQRLEQNAARRAADTIHLETRPRKCFTPKELGLEKPSKEILEVWGDANVDVLTLDPSWEMTGQNLHVFGVTDARVSMYIRDREFVRFAPAESACAGRSAAAKVRPWPATSRLLLIQPNP